MHAMLRGAGAATAEVAERGGEPDRDPQEARGQRAPEANVNEHLKLTRMNALSSRE